MEHQAVVAKIVEQGKMLAVLEDRQSRDDLRLQKLEEITAQISNSLHNLERRNEVEEFIGRHWKTMVVVIGVITGAEVAQFLEALKVIGVT